MQTLDGTFTFGSGQGADMKGKKILLSEPSHGRFPANLIVENDILDTGGKKCISEDITPIAELDSKRDGVGTKECPRPTEMSFDTDNQKAKKQSEKYPKLSREGCCPRPTNGHSQNPESGSTMSGAESQIEAIQEARHTEDGDKPFLNGMGIDVNNATQQGMMEMGDCKFTISNPMPTSQNLSLTSTTDLRSASLATKRQKTSASGENTNFSRFFSLDSWWAEKLKELPESVQRTFPFLVVPKAGKKEKNLGCEGLEAGRHDYRPNDPDENTIRTRLHGSTKKVNYHPTVKPLKLMCYLITLGSRPGDLVADFFAGTCTTAMAAKMLGRDWLMIEISEEWCQIGKRRVDATGARLI